MAGAASIEANSVASLKKVSCRGRHQKSPTSTSCSRLTTRSCGVSPIGLLQSTASGVAAAVCHHGLMLSVGLHVGSVVGSNDGIGSRVVSRTAYSGSMQLVAGSTFTVVRRRVTGRNGCWVVVVPRRHCGARCRRYLVVIGRRRPPLITLPTASLRSSPARSPPSGLTQLASRHRQCLFLRHLHWRLFDRARRVMCVGS